MKKTPSRTAQSQSSSTRQFVIGTVAGVVFASAVVWALIPSRSATPEPASAQPVAAAAVTPQAEAEPEQADFKRMSIEDAKKAIESGEVTVIDVRDMDSFVAGHIPGALHIPLSRIEGEIPYLPKGKPVLTYCTCPAEETSGAAAAILEHGGIQASALLGGLGAWRDKGFELASGQ